MAKGKDKLKVKLKAVKRDLADAEASYRKRKDKVLVKVVGNRTIGEQTATKLFAAEEECELLATKAAELQAKKDHRDEREERKAAKKAAKKAAEKAAKKAKKAVKKAAKAEAVESAAEAVTEAPTAKAAVEAEVALDAEVEAAVESTAAEPAAAVEPTAEQRARELSLFAYQPSSRTQLPNPSNPYSDEDYEFMRALLEKRVKPGRYNHSLLVSETAGKMAEAYGEDVAQARMAGLLHDWDKALLPEQLAARVADYDLAIESSVIERMPWLLHGPTAAAVLRDQFPLFRSPVFQAIERHTVGAPAMSPLDMIIFAADKLEPSHEVPAYRALYEQIGTMPLEDLFFQVLKQGLMYILEGDRPLNRDSVAVWNWYIEHLI